MLEIKKNSKIIEALRSITFTKKQSQQKQVFTVSSALNIHRSRNIDFQRLLPEKICKSDLVIKQVSIAGSTKRNIQQADRHEYIITAKSGHASPQKSGERNVLYRKIKKFHEKQIATTLVKQQLILQNHEHKKIIKKLNNESQKKGVQRGI